MTPTFTDPVLGDLRYDEELEWWEGQAMLWDRDVELYVWTEVEIGADRAALAAMSATIRRLRDAQQAITTTTAVRLAAPLARIRELKGDRTPLGHGEIAGHLNLQTLELFPDGGALLYFADGGLFGGHSILSRVEPDGQIASVDIAG